MIKKQKRFSPGGLPEPGGENILEQCVSETAREQPKRIAVNETVELVRYYRAYDRTLPWYQDLTLCKQVDNIDHPYDRERLARMYRYLSKKGECWYIKYRDQNRWRLVGDASLCEGKISIVICREFQNRHIGRAVIGALCARARALELPRVEAEIYSFNLQSRHAFEAAGFRQVGEELFALEWEEKEDP